MPSIIVPNGERFAERVFLRFRRLAGLPWAPSPSSSEPRCRFEMLVLYLMTHTQVAQGALGQAFDEWRKNAGFTGVTIQGSRAYGGKLQGPPLQPLIMKWYRQRLNFYMFQAGGAERVGRSNVNLGDPFAEAIASGLGTAWAEFVDYVSVPGLIWYPPFAKWPGPSPTPPIANMPYLLKNLSHNPASFAAARLKQSMQNVPVSGLLSRSSFAPFMYEALAVHLEQDLQKWIASQLVTNAMGFGPVPVRNGPVAGGTVLFGLHLRN